MKFPKECDGLPSFLNVHSLLTLVKLKKEIYKLKACHY